MLDSTSINVTSHINTVNTNDIEELKLPTFTKLHRTKCKL